MSYDELPWSDSTKWLPKKWYPLPLGSMWMNNPKLTFHEGYGIFELIKNIQGDIAPVSGLLLFREAFDICEARNGKGFFKKHYNVF